MGPWLLLAWLGVASAEPEMIPEVQTEMLGRTAPDFQALDGKGAPFSLANTRGQPVVLSFWASWCSPCRKELPALAAFQKQHPEVLVLAVNVDRERPLAERFMKQTPFDLPIIWDNQAMALGQYNVLSMPTLFLLDRDGTIKLHKIGYGEAEGLTQLEQALATVK